MELVLAYSPWMMEQSMRMVHPRAISQLPWKHMWLHWKKRPHWLSLRSQSGEVLTTVLGAPSKCTWQSVKWQLEEHGTRRASIAESVTSFLTLTPSGRGNKTSTATPAMGRILDPRDTGGGRLPRCHKLNMLTHMITSSRPFIHLLNISLFHSGVLAWK